MDLRIFLIFCTIVISEISGHGMMLHPPGRSSLWRYINGTEINYNDNELFCGGAYVQNFMNGGRCGICGDPYHAPHPQDNENGGFYGRGIIAATYEPGQIIDVLIRLTANHLGSFNYSLCNLPDPRAPEPGEQCFEALLLEDGSSNFTVTADIYEVYNRVALPDIICEQCVFRWTYRTGNSWGKCDDDNDNYKLGCGPQEHFRSCADIAILPKPEQSRRN